MAPLVGGKGQVSQGILANSCGEWQFKEGNTKTVALAGAKPKKEAGGAGGAKLKGKKVIAKKAAAKGAAKGSAAVDAIMAGGRKAAAGKKSQGKKSTSSRPPTTPDGKRTKGSASGMTVGAYRDWLKKMGKGGKAKK